MEIIATIAFVIVIVLAAFACGIAYERVRAADKADYHVPPECDCGNVGIEGVHVFDCPAWEADIDGRGIERRSRRQIEECHRLVAEHNRLLDEGRRRAATHAWNKIEQLVA